MYKGKYFDEVLEYAEGCITGKIRANKYRKKACQRFMDDLKNDKWDFNPKDADFVINIIEKTICHQQGEKRDGTPIRGTPFFLMTFHKFIIYNIILLLA